MIDIGANLASPKLASSEERLLREARSAGLTAIVCTGTSLESSRAALAISARAQGFVFPTAGCHPHWAAGFRSEGFAELWADPAVVAVGECGLDYDRMFSPRQDQLLAFEAHAQAAAASGKPLFLHCRAAFDDFRAVSRNAASAGASGVVHCFTGTRAQAEAHLLDGFEIGITGWIADPVRGADLRAALPAIPLDKLHLETDAPYLAPRNAPFKIRVNEPRHLPWVAAACAEILGLEPDALAEICAANSRRLFALPPPEPRSVRSGPA